MTPTLTDSLERRRTDDVTIYRNEAIRVFWQMETNTK